MRILYVLENYHPHIGGVETLFRQLTTTLAQSGHQVTVVTSRHPDRVLAEQHAENPLTIVEVPTRNRYIYTLLAPFYAYQQAKSHDLIHTTSYNAAPAARLAAWSARIPDVITFHEVWGRLWMRLPYISKVTARLHQAFERWITHLGHGQFVAVSQSTATTLLTAGVPEQRVTTIYNGLVGDYHDPKPNPESDYFLYYGRSGYSKGLDLLIDCVYRGIWPKGPTLKIISKNDGGVVYKKVHECAQKYPDIITLLDPVSLDDLHSIIRGSIAVVIPSYSEGYCYAAAETVQLGVPIVHSAMAALPEVVGGYHIAMKEHSPEGLAEALKSAVAQMWTFTPPRQFPLSECISSYLQLYDKLLDE